MAAVIGRELDLNILHTFATEDLESWLVLCANAAVLEVQENRWRFTHDKLREHLLDELSEIERPLLHRRAAEAIDPRVPVVAATTAQPTDPALTIRLADLVGRARGDAL